ncbi:MAG: 16S rRNA (guanine(527)-N(7))-methyltransferase RsmG [Clostridiales bacterium]|nr:16S rRNA (guanine(527)-N(7))-methyltransferase RsmG [Clostridiales bacterium]
MTAPITDIKNELESSNGRKIFNAFVSAEFENAAELIEKFDRLTELYFEVNAVINISALRTVDDVYIKHYLDSLYPYKHFSGAVCDVGCGGGFPTIPLAIATGLPITGVDSVGKKLQLIKRSQAELALDNLKFDYSRSEDLAKRRLIFDTVCARALADVDKAVSFCAPLLKPHGKLVLYRTQNDEPAKKSICDKYNVSLNETQDYVLPGTDIKRRLLIYRKKN